MRFTDDKGNEETLTSAATVEVAARANSLSTGAPTITGTAQVGETLSVSTSDIADADGLTNVSYSYQWVRSDSGTDTDIAGKTASAYELDSADEGKTIKVRVTFTDDWDTQETVTSAATGTVAPRPNSPATGAPTITGTAQVEETLSAETTDIADADGLTSVSYSYQWIRSDSSTDTDISGATASTYSPSIADQGKTVKVRVSFTDDAGNTETLTSAATAEVAGAPAEPNSPATGQPTISGTTQVSETLTASTSGIADADGLDNASFDYQWLTDDADIHGATGSTYALDADDEGKTLKVRVSFTDDAGNEETLTSEPTAAVAAEPNSPATGQPTITGTAQVGETLSASTAGISDANGLDNVTFAYQWIAGGSDIAGATGSTYTLTATEQGQTIQVRVSFTDDADYEEMLTSAATAAVTAAPADPLTASLENAATSHDGQTAFTFELRFSEEVKLSYKTLRDHVLTVTGGTVKKAKRLEQGSNIRWRITVEPDSSADVTVVLPVTTDCRRPAAPSARRRANGPCPTGWSSLSAGRASRATTGGRTRSDNKKRRHTGATQTSHHRRCGGSYTKHLSRRRK